MVSIARGIRGTSPDCYNPSTQTKRNARSIGMTNRIRFWGGVVVSFLAGASLSLGTGVWADKVESTSALPLDELRQFTDVFSKIKHDYVEPIDDKFLIHSAIRGMLEGLDPHSAYLDEDEFTDLQSNTRGEFGGLGIEVGMEDGFVKVIAPIDDTPAAEAGIKSGDIIVRLDETPVKGLSLNDAVNLMRGQPGTKIKLTVVRNGESQPLKFELTRAIIQVKSVKAKTLDPGYGYLRVTQFQGNTGENVRNALNKLQSQNKGGLKGLVLDLRNNPGGVLNGAVDVADAFLESGLIVYTEGRVQDASMKFSAKPGDILNGAPLVVLVNEGSASASEIVAGALQDQKRAIIMGRQSFGKGSVQSILPVTDNTAVKLTTARYFTPSGRSIQAQGIKPDIELSQVTLADAKQESADFIKEADLSRHLENAQDNKVSDKADSDIEDLAKNDYALHEALNLLKGASLWKTTGVK
jgi:carboxyl-terminal processing protease